MSCRPKTLSRNGKRYHTRDWSGSGHIKRATAKYARRLARKAIRDNDGDITFSVINGWVW